MGAGGDIPAPPSYSTDELYCRSPHFLTGRYGGVTLVRVKFVEDSVPLLAFFVKGF